MAKSSRALNTKGLIRSFAVGAGAGIFLLAQVGCSSDPELLAKLQKIRDRQQKQLVQSVMTPEAVSGTSTAAVEDVVSAPDDSARIVFVAMLDGQAQICTVQPDGQGQVQLTQSSGYKCHPAWSLDHRRIAFFQYPDERPMGEDITVMVMDANGAQMQEVVAHKKIDTKRTRISWKPDGHVIFIQEKDFPAILFGYDLATHEQAETVRMPRNSFMTEAHTLSPDNQFIAGSGPTAKTGVMHIGTIRRDGKKETDLMKPFQNVEYYLGTVVWSYDSQLVGFKLDSVIIVMSSAIRMDFRAYPISPQDFGAELSSPAFSPLGNMLACILEKTQEGTQGSGDQEVKTDIWVMKVDGSQQRQITQTGSAFDPHW